MNERFFSGVNCVLFLLVAVAGNQDPFLFNPIVPETNLPIYKTETVTQKVIAENDFQGSKQKDAEQAAVSLAGAQHGMEAVVYQNASGDLPKGLPPTKENRIKSKSGFMANDSGSAAELLSEIGPAGSGDQGDPDEIEFKREALTEMQNLSKQARISPASQPVQPEMTQTFQNAWDNLSVKPTSPFSKQKNSALNSFLKQISLPDVSGSPDGQCLPDYSVLCPAGFLAIGGQCWAQNSYEGSCEKIQPTIQNMIDEEKAAWSKKCNAKWPCMPVICPAGVDWERNCPVGWTDDGQGICQRLKATSSKCPSRLFYKRMSTISKKKTAQECNLKWRCKPKECQRNYSQQCPDGWTPETSTVCRASDTYPGPCPRFANLGRFNETLKKNFEIVCFVSWSCALSCSRDYSVPCPLGWTELKGGDCLAPLDYTGQLGRKYNFKSVPIYLRELSAKNFQVDYPCSDRSNCERDYSSSCPVGWISESDGISCRSPAFSSVVHNNIPFNRPGLSATEKERLAQTYQAEYPCIGEYKQSTS